MDKDDEELSTSKDDDDDDVIWTRTCDSNTTSPRQLISCNNSTDERYLFDHGDDRNETSLVSRPVCGSVDTG